MLSDVRPEQSLSRDEDKITPRLIAAEFPRPWLRFHFFDKAEDLVHRQDPIPSAIASKSLEEPSREGGMLSRPAVRHILFSTGSEVTTGLEFQFSFDELGFRDLFVFILAP